MAWAPRRYQEDEPDRRDRGDRRFTPTVSHAELFRNLEQEPVKIWTVDEMAKRVWNDYPVPNVTRKTIASYNWDNKSDRPKIAVPGAPREFNRWPGGDLSASMNKDRPASKDGNLDAVFTAVRLLNPEFKLKYDVASDLGAISGLFHICLQLVNAIRARSNMGSVAPFRSFESFGSYHQADLRIDVQKVGSTLLLVREKPEFKPAAGIGPTFRRICGQVPPTAMVHGTPLDWGLATGIYRMVREIKFGVLTILLADEVNAVYYPSDCTAVGLPGAVEADPGMNVTIGGFKGNLNALTPISMATLSTRALKAHPAKWLTQYLFDVPFRYVGRQTNGVIDEPPKMMTLDEIRSLCDLEKPVADLWAKVLERILLEIVEFAYHNFATSVDQPVQHFAIVVEPALGNLKIYKYRDGGEKTEAVSRNVLDYLLSNLDNGLLM